MASHSATLETVGGNSFGDGLFQPNDHVTIHNVTNLSDGLRAKVIAYDPDVKLYVVKDANGLIWGLRAEKIRAMQVLSLEDIGNEWQEVPEGVVAPKGLEISMDLSTGCKRVRRVVSIEPN